MIKYSTQIDKIEFVMSFQISFTLTNVALLKPDSAHLQCSFVAMKSKQVTIAMVAGDRVTCPLPSRTSLPSVPAGRGKDLILLLFFAC